MLIASILLLIASPKVFAESIDSGSMEYKVIKQAAKEYAIVLGSQTEVDGYQFDKNVLILRTKRASIAQEVTIELPEGVTIKGCSIDEGKLVIEYSAVIDIEKDIEKAAKKGFLKGVVYGGVAGSLAGCIFMAVVLLAM